MSVMAGVDNSFPNHQWELLVHQIVVMLNLWQQSNVLPKVFAYAYLDSVFDDNQMPLMPMGCAIQLHAKPTQQKL